MRGPTWFPDSTELIVSLLTLLVKNILVLCLLGGGEDVIVLDDPCLLGHSSWSITQEEH